jgi:hypothetical protein
MTISHEEIGDSYDACGNSYAMCGCKNCVDCKDKYAAEDMNYGFCPDCFGNSRSIPLTQGKFTIVDVVDYDFLMQWKWYCINVGYAARATSRPRKVILMHRVINNTPNNLLTDHINGNKLDNRRCNLRNCTSTQNVKNRGKTKFNRTSNYKGVQWRTHANKWCATIMDNYKSLYLGYFNTGQRQHLLITKRH